MNLYREWAMVVVAMVGLGSFVAEGLAQGKAAPPAVPGMTRYVDEGLGFSFWYPGVWKLQEDRPGPPTDSFPGCTVVKVIGLSSPRESEGISLWVLRSESSAITELGGFGANPFAADIRYSPGPTAGSWTATFIRDAMGPFPRSEPADTSDRSMGGLPILAGVGRHGADNIVPLGPGTFLLIATNEPGGLHQRFLAKTLVSSNPASVASELTPEQISTIRVEGLIYGAIGTAIGQWFKDDAAVYDRTGRIVSAANPATFKVLREYWSYAADDAHVYFEGTLLSGGDTATVEVLDWNVAKDRSHVWLGSRSIPSVDAQSFVMVDTGVARDAFHRYNWRSGGLEIDGKHVLD